MRQKLLIVEDEPDLAEPVARALRYAGHDVTIVPDGRRALLLVLGESFDLVLLDLHMPMMDGATFLSIIRSYLRLAHLPVFVLTAMPPGDPLTESALSHRVDRVFYKGAYSLDDLLAHVKSPASRKLHSAGGADFGWRTLFESAAAAAHFSEGSGTTRSTTAAPRTRPRGAITQRTTATAGGPRGD